MDFAGAFAEFPLIIPEFYVKTKEKKKISGLNLQSCQPRLVGLPPTFNMLLHTPPSLRTSALNTVQYNQI